MKVTGQKSGQINGGVILKGREGSIGVVALSHSIVSPRDPQSGLPTGQRMHKPFVVTVGLDKATPLLYNILATNENLSEVQIQFWSPQIKAATGVGAEVNDFTVTLTNANIASMDLHMPNGAAPEEHSSPTTVDVAFTYQKIKWTYTNGGITASDDWTNRTVALPSARPPKVFAASAKAPATRPVWRTRAARRKRSALLASAADLGGR